MASESRNLSPVTSSRAELAFLVRDGAVEDSENQLLSSAVDTTERRGPTFGLRKMHTFGSPFGMSRVSDYLRLNSNVSRPRDAEDEMSEEAYLSTQRIKVLKQMERNYLCSWTQLRNALLESCKAKNLPEKEVNERLKDFCCTMRQYTGDDWPGDVIETSAVFVLQLFYDSMCMEAIGPTANEQKHKLRCMFGTLFISDHLLNRTYEQCRQILKLLDESDVHFLFNKSATIGTQRKNQTSRKNKSFEYLKDTEWQADEALEVDLFQQNPDKDFIDFPWEDPSDSESSNDRRPFDFSFQYKGTIENKNPIVDTRQKPPQVVEIEKTPSRDDGLVWLTTQLSLFIEMNPHIGLPVEELVELVTTMLKGVQNDEVVESDLIELLGPQSVSLIRDIIAKKDRILSSTSYQKQQTKVVQHLLDPTPKTKQPSITQSVLIQSAEEKSLQKSYRKFEKKVMKEIKKDTKEVGGSSSTILGKALEAERQRRKQELMIEMSAPLLKEPATSLRSYPYVFDSYAEAKNTAAYICGTKMILPEGFDRKDDRRWEEITIPPASKPPPFIADKFKLVDIQKDMNELGQKVFAGFKTLNQIQSVVYRTAVQNNNNMLICAPTGAGKTNVALLAILSEISRHYDPTTGVVQKDSFKIVYIAPMKALASEMTENFSKRLKPLNLSVRELTGDMQLSKTEIMNTQMIVTTPEKWDVVTRKSKGDVQLMLLVKLLIIDEVHLLQSDRGPVLEALVARTIRHVESTQKMIRILGLSATLPNYVDVAEFLRVNLNEGLFFFDNRFRPVPLEQTFVGVKATTLSQQMHDMDDVCYEKVLENVKKGYQCMVFVHSRNATYKTAVFLRDQVKNENQGALFQSDLSTSALKMMERSKNKMLQELLPVGFAIHHAGMLRYDRNLVEKLFRDGCVKVLVCTSTLAWGVNLPAHAVVIKGTDIYDSAHGKMVDLSMLDVMQIFGRAGRPQYDTEGHGTIITTHGKLQHYLSLLTNQFPIESKFLECMTDNLNAEIVLGTVTTVAEAVEWLSYTYLHVRMMRRPIVYGVPYKNLEYDPYLLEERRRLISLSATLLDDAKMVRYDPKTGSLDPTDLGRTASHYYIKYNTVQKFNELLKEDMMEDEIIAMLCVAQEFGQLKSREEEMSELLHLQDEACYLKVKTGLDSAEGKVNILLQSALSRCNIESFSLISDSMFVQQNVVRISRGVFEYVLKKGMALMANRLLILSKMLEKGMWAHETPFRQFYKNLTITDFEKLERLKLTVDKIRQEEFSAKEIGRLMRVESKGTLLKRLAYALPRLKISAKIQPITRTVLRVTLHIVADFHWEDFHHGKISESFWIWMQDSESNHIYHYEHFKVTKKQVVKKETQTLIFTIPLLSPDNLPSHYMIHCDSEYWLGCVQEEAVPCKDIILPEKYLPFTKLLDLDPLPVTALNNSLYSSLYSFTHFNPIQTQIFHTLYHTDSNVLLGAPTGSGKTICAEIAIFRVFQSYPTKKVVYIAPLKALVRERVDDWRKRLEKTVGRKVVELTGDVTPDLKSMLEADIIVTTPEKWDGISRSWQTRRYVRDVALIIIDEIHLLGEDRGPVLEVIVSRTNFIISHTASVLRIIGLSTAIANAQDLGNWLRIGKIGLYNFKPSVRPVPLEVHVSGYPGQHYCPRMALMNKPTYRAIQQHSPDKPVIIFVSSRRQTRLTAFDIIAFVAQDNPKQWLHMTDEEMEYLIKHNIKDSNLKMTLAFGVGLHHAGLHEKDRTLCEELFLNNKIQILVTTATLAWGINLPAHLVVIKGTEFYDGKQHRYVDFPITDVLQMMGRAGRPQFDTQGKAVILVHDIKKEYYKKFLYEPFPVESSLIGVLPEHLNAEIVAGTVKTKDDCLDYLTWTYLFRRLIKNPSYYGLENVEEATVSQFLTTLVEKSLNELMDCMCLEVDEEDERSLIPTSMGRIASFYYLHHTTIRLLSTSLGSDSSDWKQLLELLSKCHEFDELPVRHNEDKLNAELSQKCRYPVADLSYDSPNTKAFLLFQAHFSRLQMPCSDYLTDLKSVLDQSIRIIQAMIDISAMRGLLATTLRLVALMQMITQGRWFDDSSLMILPQVDSYYLKILESKLVDTLPELMHLMDVKGYEPLFDSLIGSMDEHHIGTIYETLTNLPFMEYGCSIKAMDDNPNRQTIPVILHSPLDPIQQRCYVNLVTDTDYMLSITCRRKSGRHQQRNEERNSKAFAPLFPKKKDEGWVAVLGEVNGSELVALKRLGFIGSRACVHNLVFRTPNTSGQVIYNLYLLSDAYTGLDQQYELCLNLEADSL